MYVEHFDGIKRSNMLVALNDGTCWWNIFLDHVGGHLGGKCWWNMVVDYVGGICWWNMLVEHMGGTRW